MPEEAPGTKQVAPPVARRGVKPYALLGVFGVVIATLFGALATMLSAHASPTGGPPRGMPAGPGTSTTSTTSTATGPTPLASTNGPSTTSATPAAPGPVVPSHITTTVFDPTGGTTVLTLPVPPAAPGRPGGTPPPRTSASKPGGTSSSSAPPTSAPDPSSPTDPTDPSDPPSTPSDPPSSG